MKFRYSTIFATCITKPEKTKRLPRCVKPIETFTWRDCFQVNLVDYSKDPQPMWWWIKSSPETKYLLVLKDHFTRLCWAAALPQKTSKNVECELKKIFCIIGYPTIFHTDNGREFCDEVLRELLLFNPFMITTKGRVTVPQDQGSVERLNGFMKKLLDSAVIEKRLKLTGLENDKNYPTKDEYAACLNASWVTEYPGVVLTINGSSEFCIQSVEPYKAVFGQDQRMPQFEEILECSKDSPMSSIWTTEELAKILPPKYLRKMIYLQELNSSGKPIEGTVSTFEYG